MLAIEYQYYDGVEHRLELVDADLEMQSSDVIEQGDMFLGDVPCELWLDDQVLIKRDDLTDTFQIIVPAENLYEDEACDSITLKSLVDHLDRMSKYIKERFLHE